MAMYLLASLNCTIIGSSLVLLNGQIMKQVCFVAVERRIVLAVYLMHENWNINSGVVFITVVELKDFLMTM